MSQFLDSQLYAARKEIIQSQTQIPLSLADGSTINIVNEIPASANAWEFSEYTASGQASLILTAATSVPTTARQITTRVVKVYPVRLGFNVTVDEVEAGQENGRNILTEKLMDARDGINQLLDLLCYTGQAGTSLIGIANIPNVTTINFAADGTGSSAAWSTKSPDQIIRDLNQLASTVPTQTGLLRGTNKLILPASKLLYIQTRPYSTLTGESILSVFLKNQANLTPFGVSIVTGHPALETLGTGGVGLGIAYNTTSRFNRLHIPQNGDFRDLPYSLSGTTWTIPCQLKTAGLEITKPLELAYANIT
jgi:hypothetical protein